MIGYLIKFIKFSGDQKKYMISALVFGFFESVFGAFGLMASAYALTSIENGTVESLAWKCFGIMIAGLLGMALCNYFSTQFLTRAGYTAAANSRIKIADRLKYVPMGYFNNHNLGQITHTATNVAENLQETLTRCVLMTLKGYLMATVVMIAMFVMDWRIGLVTLGGFALFSIVNAILQKAGEKVSDKKAETQEKAVSAVLEYVQGIAVIKSYNLTGKANKKVSSALEEERDATFGMEKTFVPFMSMQGLVTKLAGVAIIACAIALYTSGQMSLAYALTMCVASFMVFNDLSAGGNMSSLLRLASLSIDKINETLDLPVMDVDGKDIVPQNLDVSVKDVDFAYDKRKIIDDVSVDIPSGSSLAIVGGSGSGKTTLCDLIMRFWDVNGGQITLGGNDIREYKLDSLLKNYSMVFQNVYLFNDTIANNIKFGNPDASMDEVREAARKACCDEFISALPDGYDTVIGEGGATLSGGEKQRISIARAMLKDAPIVILDEATANVDPENELYLQNAISELTKSKTVIMIAHRLKTVRHADRIIVLKDGKIVEEGTHDALMQKNGEYADFINMRDKAIGWKLGSHGAEAAAN